MRRSQMMPKEREWISQLSKRNLKDYRTIKELLEKICRLQWRKLEEEKAREV